MTNINWARFFIGGLIASVILFVTDGMMHEMLLKSDWHTVYASLTATEPQPHGSSMLYFAIFELGRGMVSMLIYVLMRPFHGAGPKTAVIAAIVGWLAFSVAGPAQYIPLGFVSVPLWVKAAGVQLITTIVGVLAGAALYKDGSSVAVSNDG
jgi:hypothetical protein